MADEQASKPETVSTPEDREQLVQRVMGDPILYPLEFRSWLRNWFEETLALIKSAGSAGGGGGSGMKDMPPGTLFAFAGPTAPPGTLICNGASLPRADYPRLFQAIGTAYGSADANSFNLPDLRDRAAFGVGSLVVLGGNDGAALGTRGPRHGHDASGVGNHSHGFSGSVHSSDHTHGYRRSTEATTTVMQGSAGPSKDVGVGGGFDTSTGGANHSHGFSGSVGDGGAHGHTISGGAFKDQVGHLGINYVIVTGA